MFITEFGMMKKANLAHHFIFFLGVPSSLRANIHYDPGEAGEGHVGDGGEGSSKKKKIM